MLIETVHLKIVGFKPNGCIGKVIFNKSVLVNICSWCVTWLQSALLLIRYTELIISLSLLLSSMESRKCLL